MAKVPLLALTVCVLALGCAGSPPAAVDPPPAPARTGSAAPPAPAVAKPAVPADERLVPRSGPGDLVVARVGKDEIRRSEVGDFAIRYFRDQANEILTQLIDERLIAAEAARLGVVLPDGLLDREVDREMADRERDVKARFGADTDFDSYLRDRFGASRDAYRDDLARLLEARLLRDRVIRLYETRTDRVEVRRAVFATRADAARAATAVRGGADLGRIAAESAVRPEVALPAIPRGAISPPELESRVFGLADGEVSDPIRVEGEGGTVWNVFKMIRRRPARDVFWPEVRPEIEAGLLKRPVTNDEYLQWAREMRQRHRVTVLR